MSQTGSGSPNGDSGIQPLVVYNCVHHRENNPIDCSNDPAAVLAAMVYNAVMVNQFPMPAQQMANYHPLNFAAVGAGSLGGMLKGEIDTLTNIARGDAEAQAVMLSNYEHILNGAVGQAAEATADAVAALGALDTMLRAMASSVPTFHRG